MSQALRSHWTQASLAALATTVVHTWPLATNPARLSLHHNADVLLNEWIVAWVQRQLLHDPLHLFSANIFHPAADALAFSEPLIVPALLGYPLQALGASPVLVHNILLLAGFVLTMVGAYALAHHWTADRLASLLAATAWTFNTQSLVRLEHLQAAHAYGVPLALLAADRLISTGNRRHAWWLAGWMVVMAYSSGYLVIFTGVGVAVLLLGRLRDWLPDASRVLPPLVLAAGAAALLVTPLYLPYRRVAVEQGMSRPLESVFQFSASLDGYLASYGRLHHWLWNSGAPREFPDAYFPGITVVLLAAIACAAHWRRGQPAIGSPGLEESRRTGLARVPVLLALAAAGVVLSLGTRTPVYGWLYQVFAPMSALRAAARFGVLWMAATALLAGLGLAALRAHPRVGRRGTAVGVLLILAVNIEAARAPFTFRSFRGVPALYQLLAEEPGRVVLVEVPFYRPEVVHENAEYVFNSTAHWRPLMNGYSGYTPAVYREHVRSFWHFPEPSAVAAMRAAGGTHLMVHPERFGAEGDDTLRRALENPSLERVAVGRNGVTLFRIR